jgi:cell division protein FtsB
MGMATIPRTSDIFAGNDRARQLEERAKEEKLKAELEKLKRENKELKEKLNEERVRADYYEAEQDPDCYKGW